MEATRTAKTSRPRRGFTLIELLVVISIIALLIGILLPVLGAARGAGQQSACLSNCRQMGIGIQLYSTDSNQYLPTHYQYRLANDYNNQACGSVSTTGYQQWSGMLSVKGYMPADTTAFVCPTQIERGWAPTNFAQPGDTITTANAGGRTIASPPTGQGSQNVGMVDTQALRLSYVGNEAVMPRLKTLALQTGGNMTLCKIDNVDKISGTIMLAEYTDYLNGISGASSSGGVAAKTHRPTNGVKEGGGTVWNGESTATGNPTTDIRALTAAEAHAAIDSVNPATGGTSNNDEHAHHIGYITPNRHGNSSNFTFMDGHGEASTLEKTLKADDFKWGLKMYSQRLKPRITTDGTTPVN
jgi:prepilin-type N-terminal cleavage/methylation domain-containing protein/prepilin-type processing-associated H-X9-DG protein